MISYIVVGAIGYFPEYDEIYWNATGNEWQYPIGSTHQTVVLPSDISKESLRISCYYGAFGSNSNCTNVATTTNTEGKTNINFMQASSLNPYEGVTVAVGFPKGVVMEPTPTERFLQTIRDNWLIFSSLLIPILAFIIMFRSWWKYGRDPRGSGVIIPQYEAPDGLTPLEVASIMREKIKGPDVSAELIYLAIHGYLNIKKEEDYVLTLRKEIDESLNESDKKILNGIFSEASSDMKTVQLVDLKNTFYKTLAEVSVTVWDAVVQKGYFVKTHSMSKIKIIFSVVLFLAIIGSSIFTKNPFLGIIVVITFAIIFIFTRIMAARTKKGVETNEHILGLKLYLETAEKDRINFHNAPEKKPEIFEKFLPYAMVLGVEKAWAKQFEGIYTTQPSWYSSGSMNAFNAGLFVGDMRDFRSESSRTLSSSPSSSSGSGGGGFSGGGGGGGGGGSW